MLVVRDNPLASRVEFKMSPLSKGNLLPLR